MTLTGPGGTGKTRLALQVAADMLDDFEDGVCFVELAPDPRPEPGRLRQSRRRWRARRARAARCSSSLEAYLRDQAAAAGAGQLRAGAAARRRSSPDLLQALRGLKVLVTSRAPLHLRGEQRVPRAAAGPARPAAAYRRWSG